MEYGLIIAGGRDFKDYELLKKEVSEFLCVLQEPFPLIISGGQVSKPTTFPERYMEELWYGADWLGLKYAAERGLEWEKFMPDWNLGKKAGPIRNKKMAEYKKSKACICFWNGVSRGTLDMINQAQSNKLNLKIINY